MTEIKIVLMLSSLILAISGCVDPGSGTDKVSLPSIDTSASPNRIVDLPPDTPAVFRKYFVKYTNVVAPNGKPIHFLVREGWTDDQVLKARNVLEHILTDAPGTKYGSDKSGIANALADRNATMILIKDSADLETVGEAIFTLTNLAAQDLRANESPAEGTEDYMNHVTRDASFEEVLHLVQDYGIRPVLPEYDLEIDKANDALVARGVWEPWPPDEPDSHRNEYIAVVYDNYLDLWAVEPKLYEGRVLEDDDIPDGTSHFGVYQLANNRRDLRRNDPDGYRLIEEFFPPYLTYTPLLPETFTGTFSMEFEPGLAYTHKSQHLVHASLRGANNAILVGNNYANRLTGNAGDNEFTGGAGDDEIDGGSGDDVAVYAGLASDYEIVSSANKITITDKTPERDGSDVLVNVEHARFSDGEVILHQ